MLRIPARINGSPVQGDRWMTIADPYTGEIVAQVPQLGAEEVDRACRAAAAALAGPGLPVADRAAILDRAAALLEHRIAEFADMIRREAGKPITAATGEVGRCIDVLRFSAAAARQPTGQVLPVPDGAAGTRLGVTLRFPRGVVAAITPFNFPLNLVAHKLAPAIAAGCPVVLKPADQTPVSALKLVDLLVEAGLPAQWISVVTGTGAEAGAPLVAHPVPAVVSFTGSVPAGHAIERAALGKKVLLELGSNAPVIIEPDADLGRAVAAIRSGGFSYAGQSCISTQRVLVHRSVAEEVRRLLVEAIGTLPVGDPADPATVVGPVISERERLRITGWLAEAAEAGAEVIGGRVDGPVVHPALVVEPDRALPVYRGEIFGPVVTLSAYDTLDEAVDLANDSDFGLHAGIFTSRMDTALAAAHRLSYGGVLINDVPTVRFDHAPYGGLRDSGNTREGPAYAIDELTQLRFVVFAG